MKGVRRENEPFSRLTNLCEEMFTEFLENRPENQGVKGVIMLHDGEDGGIMAFGIENDNELASVLIMHLQAIFTSYGKTFTILTDDHMFTP